MSNFQLYLSIGIPTFTVILALLISLFQNKRLSDKIDKLSERINRIAEQHHKDILMLMSEIVRLNDRVAKMER